MIGTRGPTSRAGLVYAGAGLACSVLALRESGTVVGAILGVVVLTLSSAGYGLLLARVVDERISISTAITTGLACLIIIGTITGWLGLWSYNVQVVAVGLGIATFVVPHLRVIDGPPRWVLGFSVAAGVFLISMKVAVLSPWFADGVNHTLEVKRLWDTGGLESVTRQPGGVIVGQSLVALAGGVGTLGVFDAGLCAALLVFLLATELSTKHDGNGLVVFLLLATPIVMNPEPAQLPMARWCGILFHASAIFALYRAARTERFSWLVVPPLLGLVALRWEFAVLAATYGLGAVWLTRKRALPRPLVAVIVIGWVVVFALLRGNVIGAALAVGVTAVAMFASWVSIPLISTFPRRSAAGVIVFAVVASSLTSFVVPKLLRTELGPPTIAFGAVIAVLALIDPSVLDGRAVPRIRIGVAALAIAFIMTVYVLGPSMLPSRRTRLDLRFHHALADLRFAAVHGYDESASDEARTLQDLIPPGSTLGFVGLSGASLDFTRNQIRDLSWVGARFSSPTRARLVGLEYLLVEHIAPPDPAKRTPREDIWGEERLAPTVHVDGVIELVRAVGGWRLYRIATARL